MASTLLKRYREKFTKSEQLFAQACQNFPNGVTHDLRMLEPFPLYINRQSGCRKWDVDGNELIDYWSGHGALLLGHSHPDIVAAVQAQVARSTHVGGCHAGEIEWGEWVRRLVPSAERVRFVGSGTEATIMAIRLARIHTGRPKLLKFIGHFHGWHDAVMPGAYAPYDDAPIPGIPAEIANLTVTLPPNQLDRVAHVLQQDRTIGAMILEPTGGHWGAVPVRGDFLAGLRALADHYGVVLIFDEVITGFRVAPGGAQQYYNVRPDLTSLAKIVAGGLPGGCLAGDKHILDYIASRSGKPKMKHPGTFNANPLSAAAGIATLQHIATGLPCSHANAMGRLFRNRFNALCARQDWPWIAYGDFSMFRLLFDYEGPRPIAAATDNDGFIPYDGDLEKLDGVRDQARVLQFRRALLLEGVDLPGLGGWLSAAHTERDIDFTIQACDNAIRTIQNDDP